jgi:hypothetical protein
MKKALMLVAYPKIPGTVPGYRMQVSARRDQSQHGRDVSLARILIIDLGSIRRYGNKPSILEVGRSVLGERPNSPAIVLKERLHTVIRQSAIGHLAHIEFSFFFCTAAPGQCASLTVNRDLAVTPSVQTVRSAKPNATVPRR